ncbi:MAG: hypothetical protein IKV43_00210 [Clostridia bacterium]|nr:hypothetical protein [Clostridia bacterium]
MIIYSKSSGNVDAAIGRIDTPIKMYIEHESDLMKKKGGIRDWLFNVEKSNHFAETVVTQRGFNLFEGVAEGEGAPKDTAFESTHKTIEHMQYMKEFTISAEMMEDAATGIAASAKRRIQNFVRSYYNTINKACATALIHATEPDVDFAGTTLNLTSPDGFPLFYSGHTYTPDITVSSPTQSNYFQGDFAREAGAYKIDKLAESLYSLANKLRCMKDECGEPTGYVADTVILPGNKPNLELMIKKICGSEGIVGSADNDINIHYGKWNVIILPNWTPDNDDMMVMSSEANAALAGNLFFERVPLTVTPWVDHHTGNYNWTGRCRFGIGFGSYKHIVRVTDSFVGTSDFYE